ncbi:MAG: 3-keto-disaccharide hydrolase [Chitinophagaceae bacterium]
MYKDVAIALCAALFSVSACNSQKKALSATQINTLTRHEQNNGWKLLFDGKTTKGWHTYNRDTVSKNWKVIDGTLVANPKEKTTREMEDIVTNNQYENYELALEWRISEGGNSGIIFNIKEDPKFTNTYNTGLEMQILDNIKASDNKKETHLAGLLYDISGTAAMSKPKPVGEWNAARIIQKNGRLTFYFNGVKTFDGRHESEEWKNMIANSKFKTWENFALSPKGKIAFQDHGHEVAFRNIKIKQL